MISLLPYSLTVPQVFFNRRHVGGAAELDRLEASGELESWIQDMKAGSFPIPTSEAELFRGSEKALEEAKVAAAAGAGVAAAAAAAAAAAGAAGAAEGEGAATTTTTTTTARAGTHLICVGEECATFCDISEAIRRGVEIRDRTHNLTNFHQCFVASEAGDFLIKHYNLQSREEAVQVGETLVKSGVMHHVRNEHHFGDKYLFFRLQVDTQPLVLNNSRPASEAAAGTGAQAILASCSARLSKLKAAHIDDAGLVNFRMMQASQEFEDFHYATCELQNVKLERDLGGSDAEKLSFFINLYNMMVVHAFATVGIPESSLQRLAFFDHVQYSIGGALFSLNDVENGVLRRNRTPPYHLRLPFEQKDPRLALILEKDEPRIHFALNCGASSCPPVKTYSAAAIEEELSLAAAAFCEQDENVLPDTREGKRCLKVSKIVYWYNSDFGKSGNEVARRFAAWALPGSDKKEALEELAGAQPTRLKFFAYDWTANASDHKIFDVNRSREENSLCLIT